MRIIYKYTVEDRGVIVEGDEQRVILVGVDPKLDDAICIWVEHTHTEPTKLEDVKLRERRTQYLTMGTGFRMEDDDSFHAGSCITPEGYVWHVYGKTIG